MKIRKKEMYRIYINYSKIKEFVNIAQIKLCDQKNLLSNF